MDDIIDRLVREMEAEPNDPSEHPWRLWDHCKTEANRVIEAAMLEEMAQLEDENARLREEISRLEEITRALEEIERLNNENRRLNQPCQ